MDWSVDDYLYSRFKTLKLKSENILQTECASLSDEESPRHFLDGQLVL